eukprot:CAMPEP_0168702244 /NCGR_PEP_ID=MMETSP0503-20121227/38426_1 /TAXON_ID=89963 /ORGANISM="Heterocapsa rotundata, Strain SCCAP K-0483" /LENGTH=74 /DNA_ID=CAMNT_0008748347 /DNA_START=120 /DNA_END=340 /DNA_ORIENTATION=+
MSGVSSWRLSTPMMSTTAPLTLSRRSATLTSALTEPTIEYPMCAGATASICACSSLSGGFSTSSMTLSASASPT